MKGKILFGTIAFDRESIPEHLRDVSTWPSVNHTVLTESRRETYLKRVKAIELFVTDPAIPVATIEVETGVPRTQIYTLTKRCLKIHEDQRIYGFRALMPYVHVEPYERSKNVSSRVRHTKAGAAGAFMKLLSQYGEIEAYLKKEVKNRRKPNMTTGEVGKANRKIFAGFISLCKRIGISDKDYPFNQEMQGSRTLAKYLKQLTMETMAGAVSDAGGRRVKAAWPSSDDELKPPALRPYEIVEFDGHKLDLRLKLLFEDPFGMKTTVETTRIWILVLLDVHTRAILGYYLALGKEYDKTDVVEAIRSAILPHRRRDLKIPGLGYSEDGGFPSEVYPELAYACWDNFRFDNARSHLSNHSLNVLSEIVGCWPDVGPPYDPDKRPFVERFFGLLAEHFTHRLPGTTGASPSDIRRFLNDPDGDLSLVMSLDELEELIDVMLSNYNGEPHSGLGSRSPLEAMGYWLNKDKSFLRPLARRQRNNLCLLQEGKKVVVRGGLEQGVRPHVNFESVRYSSDVLSEKPWLVGKPVWIYFDAKDIRYLHAFFDDGAELGKLVASRPWCYTPHSLKLRKEIQRLIRIGHLKVSDCEDPVEVYLNNKRLEAKRNKRAATQLAKAQRNIEDAKATLTQENTAHEPNISVCSTAPPTHAGGEPGGEESSGDPKVKSLGVRKTVIFR